MRPFERVRMPYADGYAALKRATVGRKPPAPARCRRS